MQREGWNDPGYMNTQHAPFYGAMAQWLLDGAVRWPAGGAEARELESIGYAVLLELEAEVEGYAHHWTLRDQFSQAKSKVARTPFKTRLIIDSDWEGPFAVGSACPRDAGTRWARAPFGGGGASSSAGPAGSADGPELPRIARLRAVGGGGGIGGGGGPSAAGWARGTGIGTGIGAGIGFCIGTGIRTGIGSGTGTGIRTGIGTGKGSIFFCIQILMIVEVIVVVSEVTPSPFRKK